jgi:alpha-tubulin suppressor-like RCC1 family protein
VIDHSNKALRGLTGVVLALLATLGLSSCLSGAGPAAPTIREQPKDRTVFATQTASFDIGAVGKPPLTFQWRRNGVAIPGATSFSYTTDPVTLADSGAKFSLVISNAEGSVTSSEATLTVNPPPTVTASPVAQSVNVGGAASFTVAASGESLSYQWLRDDVPISGATTATYSISATVAGDDGAVFSAYVGNPAGYVTSGTAALTVLGTPALVSQPLGQSVAAGEPASFSIVATGGNLAYQWLRAGVVIPGATARVYTLPSATLGDDGVAFTVTASNTLGAVTSQAATLRVQTRTVAALAAPPAELALSRSATAAASFMLVRRQDGTVASWGYNSDGQRGDGTTATASDTIGTVTLPSGRRATAVAAGGSHALVLLDNGAVYAWGANASGQLGLADQVTRTTPTLVTLARPAVAIAAGRDFSVVALDDGRVFAWGLNSLGQLGTGSRDASLSPAAVAGLTGVVAVAAGGDHALALRSDGTVWAWGANAAGQLGDGTLKLQRTPVATPLRGIARIRAGGDESLAISLRRVAYAWGENTDGLTQLIGSDGIVRSAGSNETGSLGDGTTTARNTYAPVSVVTGAVAVGAGGRSFGAAVKSDGTTYTWGDNSAKQLGNSAITSTGTSTPTAVPSFDAIP